jgi:putative modified peptide
VSKQLSEKTVDALLDKLAEDDGFRARFQANPKAAVQSLGTDDPAIESLPDGAIRELAPKAAFRKSRSVMRSQLLASRAPFVPVTLDTPE